MQTALAIFVAKRLAFLLPIAYCLLPTAEPATGLDMKMLKTPVSGKFFDFRDEPIDLDRAARLAMGDSVPVDAHGVIFHPPERPSAVCISVLRSDALGRTLQTNHYKYVWDGGEIASLYSFSDDGKVLSPKSLSEPTDAVAA